jgi:hypothetical protein
MSHEMPHIAPLEVRPVEVVTPPPAEPALPPQLTAVDPEQVQQLDAFFARKDENSTVAGLLGLWTGALVLHDVARDHFAPPVGEVEDEEEPEKKKR